MCDKDRRISKLAIQWFMHNFMYNFYAFCDDDDPNIDPIETYMACKCKKNSRKGQLPSCSPDSLGGPDGVRVLLSRCR